MSVKEKEGVVHPSEKVIHSVEPIRLFKSDFLEFFSHISPKVIVAIWLPTIVFCTFWGVTSSLGQGLSPWAIAVTFFAGWFLWTFVEYVIHRFVFHYHPKTQRLKDFFFTFHGVHHVQPMCKTRLVMPPAISVPLSVFFYGIFYLVGAVIFNQPSLVWLFFAGFGLGYLLYDIIHYTLHHSKSKNGYLAMCRRQHMRHHFKCPNMRFGVSIPIWDYVFGTMPSSGLGKKMTLKDKG